MADNALSIAATPTDELSEGVAERARRAVQDQRDRELMLLIGYRRHWRAGRLRVWKTDQALSITARLSPIHSRQAPPPATA